MLNNILLTNFGLSKIQSIQIRINFLFSLGCLQSAVLVDRELLLKKKCTYLPLAGLSCSMQDLQLWCVEFSSLTRD